MLLILLVLSLTARQAVSSNVSLDLHLYQDAEEQQLLCNDGSPAGYYFRPAPEDAEDAAKDRWIFYLEGGGWCWNETECFMRILLSGNYIDLNTQVEAGYGC